MEHFSVTTAVCSLFDATESDLQTAADAVVSLFDIPAAVLYTMHFQCSPASNLRVSTKSLEALVVHRAAHHFIRSSPNPGLKPVSDQIDNWLNEMVRNIILF